MSTPLVQLIREKRERELKKEKLLLLAKKVKVLSEEASDLHEYSIGAELLDLIEHIKALPIVREEQ